MMEHPKLICSDRCAYGGCNTRRIKIVCPGQFPTTSKEVRSYPRIYKVYELFTTGYIPILVDDLTVHLDKLVLAIL
jgi:hypothetical protein